ncbi:unnamed protein product, partial [Owenia fusiformis]
TRKSNVVEVSLIFSKHSFKMMCGGPSDVKEADADVQRIIEQVRDSLEEKAGVKFTEFVAVHYKTQVVAGTNYFVKIRTNGDEHTHARIFQSLPHAGSTLEAHSVLTGKTLADPLEYF